MTIPTSRRSQTPKRSGIESICARSRLEIAHCDSMLIGLEAGAGPPSQASTSQDSSIIHPTTEAALTSMRGHWRMEWIWATGSGLLWVLVSAPLGIALGVFLRACERLAEHPVRGEPERQRQPRVVGSPRGLGHRAHVPTHRSSKAVAQTVTLWVRRGAGGWLAPGERARAIGPGRR
jgi:hypothetical protein